VPFPPGLLSPAVPGRGGMEGGEEAFGSVPPLITCAWPICLPRGCGELPPPRHLLTPPRAPRLPAPRDGWRWAGEEGEREALTATALSPGWVERNENLLSSFFWVFRSRPCLPGWATPLRCLCALLCVCCCHHRCTPSCHFAARSRSLSRLSLSLSLSLYLLFTEDYSPFPTLPPRRAAPLPSVWGERLARRGSCQLGSSRQRSDFLPDLLWDCTGFTGKLHFSQKGPPQPETGK